MKTLFISYETNDGLPLAKTAKSILEDGGHDAWVWHLDAVSGAYTKREIALEIIARDYFLYLCTQGSDVSDGQEFERAVALEKKAKTALLVVTFDMAHVSPELMGKNCHLRTLGEFEEECRRIAQHLQSQQELTISLATRTAEGQPIEPA